MPGIRFARTAPRVLVVLIALISSAAWGQNCSSPPTGFGGSWWRAYAAWCSACGGTPNSSNLSCTPGPNWGGRGGAGRSVNAPAPTLNNDAAVQQQEEERQRREAERQREEEQRQREEAEAASRRQQEFERHKAEALGNMKGIAETQFGLKGVDTSGGLGLKEVRVSGPGDLGLKSIKNPAPAWDAQITNPQIAKLAKGLDAIQVPSPLPQKEASLSFEQVSNSSGTVLEKAGDVAFLAWDLLGKFGDKGSLHVKVILIAGRVFIAGEDGAYIHLVKQDKIYEDALHYLKDPATSRQFANIVRDLKEKGSAPASADPDMVRAARAISDPALGSSGTRIAWDSMMSPEARAAMARKACLEIGTELVHTGVSEGTENLLRDLTKRKELYAAARLEREEARRMLKHSTDALDKDQLRKVIAHANNTLEGIYRLERAGPVIGGELAAIHVERELEGFSEETHSQEK
jgi:hypothetical protein